MTEGGTGVYPGLLALLLRQVCEEVDKLPKPAVPLAAALVSAEAGLPAWFRDWLMGVLGRRVPLEEVSPAAEAVLRLREFGRYATMDFALREIEAQYALLHALGMVSAMYEAVDFVTRLSDILAQFASPLER